MQCDRERMRPRETVLKWHANALSVTRVQPLCANGYEETNSKRPMYACLNARSQRSATLQALRVRGQLDMKKRLGKVGRPRV